MKLLVIGSNSFSGSHFIDKALTEGAEVWGVSRSSEIDNVFLPYKWSDGENEINQNFRFKQLDLNYQLDDLLNLVMSCKPNIIVNFAAQGMVAESWKNPLDWYQTNLLSQVALHDQLRRFDFIERYVHVTTPEVYGSTDSGWINEECIFNPSTPYAVSRAACDMHLKSFFKAYSFPVVFTRTANVYGPGQQLYRIIPRAILAARTGSEMQLHGGGYSERSFIHIKDAMNATWEIATKSEAGETWHISTNHKISIRHLVEEICNMCKTNFEDVVRVTGDRLGKDQSYLLDSNKIRKKLFWSDQVSLESGLADTIQWVDSNLNLLRQLPWSYQHKR